MILLVFPNQLFAKHPGLSLKPSRIILVEDSLFFGDHRYPMQFHQQKLWLHRVSMKRYEAELREQGYEVTYVEFDAKNPSLAGQIKKAINDRAENKLCYIDTTDFILEKRLRKFCVDLGFDREVIPNPGFINSREENLEYRAGKKRWFMADFYKWQRTRLDILMNGNDPVGDQWSFDDDNRKKVPKKLLTTIPTLPEFQRDEFDMEAKQYVQTRFAQNPGNLDRLIYPTSHRHARRWLDEFLNVRFPSFGDYEDAIMQGESWLWHSVLTPSLNIGLLTPDEVVQAALEHAREHNVPINSLEGFVRQIIGWREFMRATYEDLGVAMRTTNHWRHTRPMPARFYDGTTGVLPIDDCIQRIQDTGYCHHIERLMVLGGFMFLCEIDSDEIYRWFMEMFIDSYDWVMVPNVYAMSQNADGGAITTKPYFSGSSYIRKMSHYKAEPWCEIWDGLYWRWIWNHVDDLGKNPRWAMMCSMAKKMDTAKRKQHLKKANDFLECLW